MSAGRRLGRAAELMAEAQHLLEEALEADLMETDMYLDEAKKRVRSLLRLASRRSPDTPQFLRVYAETARLLVALADYMLTLRFATEAGQCIGTLASPERELEEAGAVFRAVSAAVNEHLDFILSLYVEEGGE